MIIKYANSKIEKICNDSKYAAKWYSPKIVQKLGVLMYYLASYDTIDNFYKCSVLKKYKIHELIGDKKGKISLSIDYSYRMELIVLVKNKDGNDVIEILEVTNHYGD